jgi:hypothetical protein
VIVGNYFVVIFILVAIGFFAAALVCKLEPGDEFESAKAPPFFIAAIALGAIAALLVDLGATTWWGGT